MCARMLVIVLMNIDNSEVDNKLWMRRKLRRVLEKLNKATQNILF